jgi:hypothetical protein
MRDYYHQTKQKTQKQQETRDTSLYFSVACSKARKMML